MPIEKKPPLEQTVMNVIKDMVFIMKVVENSIFYYDFLNHAAVEGTGLTQSVLGKSFFEVYPIEKAAFLSKQYKRALESLESHTYEDSHVSSSGEKYYSKTELTPITDDSNKCSHLVAIVKDITEEKKAQVNIKAYLQKIYENERRYFSLFYYNSDIIFSLDFNGRILDGNIAVENVIEYSVNELINTELINLVIPEDIDLTRDYFLMVLKGRIVKYQTTIISKPGNRVNVSVKFTPIIINNNVVGVYAVLKDITEQTKLLSKLSLGEKKYRHITENIHDLITVIDAKGKITYASPSYKSILGFDPKEYEGELSFYNVHPEDINILEKTITESLISGQPCKMRFRQTHRTKGWIWFELHGTPVYDDFGQLDHMVLVSRDISIQKKYEAKLKQFAYYDPLTELPNRRFLRRHVQKVLKTSKKKQQEMAFIMMDIDNFKTINDQLGHDIGDAVITEFGKRIRSSIRDIDVVARFGGDEFIIVLPNIESTDNIIPIVKKIQETIRKPWNINNNSFEVTTSIGIVIVKNPLEDLDEVKLIKIADNALYEAKESGKDTFKIKSL